MGNDWFEASGVGGHRPVEMLPLVTGGPSAKPPTAKPSVPAVVVAGILTVALLAGCGGGGGGGSRGFDTPEAVPPPAMAAPLTDAIPAPGVAVDPSTGGVNVIHVGDGDWRFEYDGECGPTGMAFRHALVDLGGPDDGREVVDHRLACLLEPGTGYEVRVDATAGDGTRHRAVLEFRADTVESPRGVTVLDSTTLSRRAVDRLFDRYVREAVLAEIDIPVVGALAALLVAEIAARVWTELGAREATYGVVSHAVTYASRSPSGAAATLSGLVAMPEIGEDPGFARLGRVVVLHHATGSTPSRLGSEDGWYVLANLLAGRGYLVVAPDNWGRGADSGADQPETYLMANRTANNALDMVREVLADDRYRTFHAAPETVDAALVGYSQGGHSTIAHWLANAAVGGEHAVREVHAGGGPHDLQQTFLGVLHVLNGSCAGDPWCRDVDVDVHVPYAFRILPPLLRYTEAGLTPGDVLDGERLSDAFVTGMLDGEERFDALKTMLQLNSFANLVDLAGAMPTADTRVHLYHSPLDRLVPQQNSRELAAALSPGFDLTTHFGVCDSSVYEELADLVDTVGVIHAICAFDMFDRVLRDLRLGEAARAGYDRVGPARVDPALPWLALAERRAAAALADPDALAAFRAARPAWELHRHARRLRAAESASLRELADRLQP